MLAQIALASRRAAGRSLMLCVTLLLMGASNAIAQPAFTQQFSPNTIGPGSVSVLTYTITNGSGIGVTDMAFSNVLPAGMTLATGANPFSSCTDAVVSAADGGTVISLADARLGAGSSCIVRVDVTGAVASTYNNVSGSLTSSAGNSGTSSDSLDVLANRLGFTKSFSPSLIQVDGTSRLTFAIDAGGVAGSSFNISFTDNLPAGLRVADPPQLVTDCVGNPGAIAGSSTITLFSGFLAGGASCTLAVDVVAEAAGRFDNRSGTISSQGGVAGSANAVLNATRSTLLKTFGSSTPPGDLVELIFDIRNYDRGDSLTNLTFSDDLDAMLSGAAAVGLPLNDVCGAGSQISGTSLLTLTGGNIAPSASCRFSVMVQVPAAAAPGSYPNTTSAITGLLSAAAFVDAASTATLEVISVPRLTKTIIPGTARPGELVTVEFTLQNNDATNAASAIEFVENNGVWLSNDTPITRPANGFCGAGSIASAFSAIGVPGTRFQGMNLVAGASCTFQISFTLPTDFRVGTYPNVIDSVTATVNGVTTTGGGASDTLEVIAAPSLSKAFIDDPVNAGDLVTLEFNLSLSENSSTDATAISFTDDLNAALAGLTAIGLPLVDPCGAGSSLTGTSTLSFTGGTLSPGTSCSFTVQLQTPVAAASGDYTNITSNVSAMVAGLNITDGAGASAVLRIQPLVATKRFVESPIFAGTPSVTLEFTLENLSASEAISGIFFTDSLSATLSGLIYNGGALANPCGAGSSLSGTTFLTLTGGSLAPGASCTFSIALDVPAGAQPGDYGNVTSSVVGMVGGAGIVFPAASDVLSIVEPLELRKSFTDDPVRAGDPVTLEFTVTNNDPAQAITAISFTDDLDAALSGLSAIGLPAANVCGAGSMISGSSVLTLAGANLPAGGSCLFSVNLQVPAGALPGNYQNVTSTISGTSGAASVSSIGATDLLVINGSVDFSKNFSAEVFPGNAATLNFSLTNTDPTNPVSDLRFSDDLNAMLAGAVATGLPLTDPCGVGSSFSGTSTITLLNGSLPASGSCSFAVSVAIPAMATPGSYLNSTDELTSSGTNIAPGATASLGVNPRPLFNKLFGTGAVFVGQSASLSFLIDNSASAIAASGLDFTDNLPAGMVVATPANASTTCTGGTITAAPGSAVISYTGGAAAASSTCIVSVDIVASTPGSLTNTTGNLTSIAGDSGPAMASILIDPLPVFTKTFIPDTVSLGQTPVLRFQVDNSGVSQALIALAFTDNLPAGLVLGTPANASNNCGGTLTAIDGGGSITLTGGMVAPGALCTIDVDVLGAAVGDYTNTSSVLSYSGGVSPAASDSLRVNPLPLFSKTFAPNAIPVGNISTLSFTIDNSGSTAAATGLSFIDNYPPGLGNATPANATTTCTGGTLTAADGAALVDYVGGSVAAGASCTISVDVTAPGGIYPNSSGNLISDGGSSPGANATLTISTLPLFSKLFTPDALFVNQVSRLSLAIDHTAGNIDATALDVSDNLPAGVVIATPANASTTCVGGTLTAAAGSGTLSYSGGSVVAGTGCEVGVDVVSAGAGTYVNTTGDLTSSLGNSGTASDTLQVDPAPSLAKSFSPAQIFIGQISTVTLGIDNSGSTQDLTGVSLSDNLPAGLAVATPSNAATTCTGGTLTATSGSATVSYSGGTVTAGTSCTISFDVDANAPGSLLNTTSDLVSNAGTLAGASDTLIVDPVPLFAKAFAPDAMAIDDISTLTLNIDNSGSATAISAIDFTDNLPAGLMLATPANASSTCAGGTLTAVDGGSAISYTSGGLAAGASCAVSADVTSAAQGVYSNTTGDLTSNAGNSGTASATLTVSNRPTLSKAFTPAALFVNQPARLTLTIDHSAGSIDATAVDLSDTFPAGLVQATPSNASTTCTGTPVFASGMLSFTGGTVTAGTSCEIGVDVVAASAGSYVNTTGDLSSNLGNSGSATATLVVDNAPTLTKAFAPALVFIGQSSNVTLTIDSSTSSQSLSNISLTDNLPAGLLVATPSNASTTCNGGSLTAVAGSAAVSYSGGSLDAGASCTISFDVTTTLAGDLLNSAGPLTSNAGDSGNASATLRVDPLPALSKRFDPEQIIVGDTTLVVLTIDNSSSTQPVTGLSFTDDLPGTMRVALPNLASHDCGAGTLTAPSGATSISFSGGDITAGAVCTVQFAVVVPLEGNFLNVTSPLLSDVGNSPAGASAELNVQPSAVAVDATSRFTLMLLALLMIGLAVWIPRRMTG